MPHSQYRQCFFHWSGGWYAGYAGLVYAAVLCGYVIDRVQIVIHDVSETDVRDNWN